MTTKRLIMNRILLAAPWLTVLLLMGMSVLLPNRSEFSPEAQVRKTQVAAAMQAIPLFIGDRWIGEERPVPKEAQMLLHPNAILSRAYSSPGGPTMQVLVVHCGDARDMIGHYPPICYPSAGWVPAKVDGAVDTALEINGQELPVRQYGFSCIGDHGRVETIRIFNAFILPDGTVTRQIDDIDRQSERLAVSIQGVAQVQVIISASVPLHEAIDSANEVLSGMKVMFEALRVGQGASRET